MAVNDGKDCLVQHPRLVQYRPRGRCEHRLMYDLTGSVDSARALAPRDVATALGLIAHGEYKISLELICAQVDEHDSLPSCEELEALRRRGAG